MIGELGCKRFGGALEIGHVLTLESLPGLVIRTAGTEPRSSRVTVIRPWFYKVELAPWSWRVGEPRISSEQHDIE